MIQITLIDYDVGYDIDYDIDHDMWGHEHLHSRSEHRHTCDLRATPWRRSASKGNSAAVKSLDLRQRYHPGHSTPQNKLSDRTNIGVPSGRDSHTARDVTSACWEVARQLAF